MGGIEVLAVGVGFTLGIAVLAVLDRNGRRTRPEARRRDAAETAEFDWKSIPEVDEEELVRFVGGTDKVERQFPLVLALQVHDELEQKLMAPVKLDALAMSEVRGGMKALRRFCQIYKFRAVDENRKGQVTEYGEED